MFTLPNLPYAYDALQPTMSDKTLHHHHDKHHAKYVDTLNTLLKDKAGLGDEPLEALIAQAREGDKKLFNNAAQAWNHGFFWECLSPDAGQPSEALKAAIDADFGGLDGLKKALVTEGVGHFASGWAWLVHDGQHLKVISTHDAETVADRDDVHPILVIDVWEHAYYLDFQQDREGFLKGMLDRIANWAFASRQFDAAKNGGQGGYRYPAPERKAA
ncbi:MAG: superoxide dismutase [Pseudomonadota bacterium]|nr:superoxide dismutase [Pseudomonadota bacterium]